MSSLINFSKRHKKKLIFTFLVFGGGYCGFKYAMYKLKQFLLMSTNTSELVNEQILSMRKTEHYLSIKETSDQGVLSLIKTMQNKINERLSCDDLLEQLKNKPVNKLAIWESLKIKCIAKCLTCIYATALLTLFVKIELNIIGAYLFLSNSSSNCNKFDDENEWSTEFILEQQNTLSADVQHKFLGNIENFVNNGLPELMTMIESHCDEVFRDISLKESLNIEFISEKIEFIQKKIEDELFCLNDKEDDESQENFFTKFMLPDLDLNDNLCELMIWNDNKKIKSDHEVLVGLNLETYDLLTSNDFQLCTKSITKLYTNEFLDTLTSQLVQQLVSSGLEHKVDSIVLSMPFARLIPILNKTNEIFEMSSLNKKLIDENNLNVFSANIYEAFSVKKKQMMMFDEMSNVSLNSSLYNKESMLNQVH